MTPTVESLALEFSQALRSYLTHEEMAEVVLRNRVQTSPSVCHSHDFCDANMVLHEVFMKHCMDVADEGGMERWGALWDRAWNLAKANEFQVDDAPTMPRKTQKTATFKLGDKVEILKEFQNPGDETFTWVVVGDEEKGRVDIAPIDINLDIKPINTVQAHWIKLAND